MSSSYNLEPPPTAKVLLQTTSGDIELEIFAKQTPLTSRNFLQHCLDGYYNGTIFHRLVPGFVLQGGDPTGTGDGGDSIYPDGPFADEIHNRLKFNRRGLLGMANTGRKDDNGSQFFLTLGKTEELTGKNTMFGRVVGDTIYNVVKMGEAELMDGTESERPLYPTKITGAEILLNPFSDMAKRESKTTVAADRGHLPERKKTKKKGGKVLLSFGGEEGEELAEPVAKKAKFNTKLVADNREDRKTTTQSLTVPAEKKERSIRRRASRSPTPPSQAATAPKVPEEPKLQLPLPDEEDSRSEGSSSPEPEQIKKVSSMLDRTNAQIAELKASMKRTIAPAATESKKEKSALEEMIPENAIRGRKRKQGNRDTSSSDAQALKMLNAFRAKLNNAPEDGSGQQTENSKIGEQSKAEEDQADDEEGNLCDLHFIVNCQSCSSWDKEGDKDEAEDANDRLWMSHTLRFEKDKLGKDLSWKKQKEDDLVVIDPREKSRGMKEQRKDRRDERNEREAGREGSGRDWDRKRDRDRGKDADRERHREDKERRRDGDRYRDREGERSRHGERSGNWDERRDRDRHRDRDRDRPSRR